ncbi:hypothetical protein [Aurantivibrio infirmus]
MGKKIIIKRFAMGILCSLIGIFSLSLFAAGELEKVTKLEANQQAIAACAKPRDSESLSDEEYEQLEAEFGARKTIPEQHRKPILLALSHYPELKDSNISFEAIPSTFALESRPSLLSLFGREKNRRYRVIINSDEQESFKAAFFGNLSAQAQVGAVGHELGHTVYYRDKNLWQLAMVALAYPWNSFRARFERETDIRAVEHCLGSHLLEWSKEIRVNISGDWGIDRYYLAPFEIENLLGIETN